MKKLLMVGFFILTLTAQTAFSAGVGFIQGNIWFSKDPFFAGDTVRVYSAVFNGIAEDITGTVVFYVDSASIGQSDFSITSGARLREVWIDWKATEGDHSFSAKITKAFSSKAGETPKEVEISGGETAKVNQSVDLDTDKDGIGNKVDSDDDGDGISDANEIKNNTNPLVKDHATQTEAVKGKAQEITQTAIETAKEATQSTRNFIDKIANAQKAKLEVKQAELKKEIAELVIRETVFNAPTKLQLGLQSAEKAAEKERGVLSGKNAKTVELFLVSTAIVILGSKFILYTLIIVIAFGILKFVFSKIFRRRSVI